MARMIPPQELEKMLGCHISAFCESAYAQDSDNHCAHFVSHLFGYGFGATCRMMSSKPRGDGANIRVQEIFPRCPTVGRWEDLPATQFSGLVFIGNAGHFDVRHKRLDAVSRLHMGLFHGLQRKIYHYSNKFHKVVTETPDQFSNHFAAPDNALFWGALP